MSELLEKARSYEAKKIAATDKESKPLFHISAPAGWINDPNGFSVYNGKIHLFYQYYPYLREWGPMHWGHSTTSDMIKWEQLPCVLAPDEEYDKKGNRSQEIAFQDELCLLVPNGGEVVLDNKYNDIDNAAKDLASMHVSYLNNAHDLTVINKWKKQTYTDPDGDSVYNGMSAYDYVTTRLGYRYCLLSSSFEHKNNAFGGSLQITLKNEGFAPSYKDFDVELFIIKDDNSAAPTDSYSAAADNTDIVYSENLTEKYPASTWTPGNEINLDISIPLLQIKKAGNITKVNNYSIYLVVRDKISGEIIKFANDASYNDYGYYIGSLKI